MNEQVIFTSWNWISTPFVLQMWLRVQAHEGPSCIYRWRKFTLFVLQIKILHSIGVGKYVITSSKQLMEQVVFTSGKLWILNVIWGAEMWRCMESNVFLPKTMESKSDVNGNVFEWVLMSLNLWYMELPMETKYLNSKCIHEQNRIQNYKHSHDLMGYLSEHFINESLNYSSLFVTFSVVLFG